MFVKEDRCKDTPNMVTSFPPLTRLVIMVLFFVCDLLLSQCYGIFHYILRTSFEQFLFIIIGMCKISQVALLVCHLSIGAILPVQLVPLSIVMHVRSLACLH
jgi:hypothetical protein